MATGGIGTPLTRSAGCHSGFAARSRLIRSCKSLSPLRWDCSSCDSELLRDLGSSRSGKSQKLNVTTQQPSHEESTISRLQHPSSDVTGAQPRAAASSSSSSERRQRVRDTMRRPVTGPVKSQGRLWQRGSSGSSHPSKCDNQASRYEYKRGDDAYLVNRRYTELAFCILSFGFDHPLERPRQQTCAANRRKTAAAAPRLASLVLEFEGCPCWRCLLLYKDR